jgi:hypothetical protein
MKNLIFILVISSISLNAQEETKDNSKHVNALDSTIEIL